MTLAKFPHDIIRMQCTTKLGVGGGDILSIDTSLKGASPKTIRCVPVQEQGTTAGQDDIILGVSLTGTVGPDRNLIANEYVGIITHGVVMIRVANNTSGWAAGDDLYGETDTQTVLNNLYDYPASQQEAGIKCGVANHITLSSLASIDAAKHLAQDYERARYVGIALDDQADISGAPLDDQRNKVLFDRYPRFVYATS